MASKYLEVCKVTRWFWWRVAAVILLFAFLSAYFFYDWKVGYPKKNYQRAQYETFEKARDTFLKHSQMNLSEEFWETFVQKQPLVFPKNLEWFASEQVQNMGWPEELKNYDLLQKELQNNSESQDPLLWRAYQADLGGATPLPQAYQKKAYEENYRLLLYRTFQEATRLFKDHVAIGGTAKQWEFISAGQTLAFERNCALLPKGCSEERWPQILSDYATYRALAARELESGISVKEPYLWKEFTSQQKWSQQPPESFYSQDQINEQFYYGIGSAVISLVALIVALAFTKRFMAVDASSYYAPNGVVVRFQDLRKIDKRNWKTKGLATLYYESQKDGAGKVKVDGMIYGQFDKAQGAPAERLFQIILDNFSGELVDYEEIDVNLEKS